MATLTPLTVGNAVAGGGWDSAPNGALGDNSDTTYGYSAASATGNYDQGWELGNVDANFGTMATCAIVLRYAMGSTPTLTTWTTLSARIMSGATVLAAADSGGGYKTVASSITTTTPTNSGSISFDYVNTSADKTAWDAAQVDIRIVRTKSKGGSTEQSRVFEADVTGTYNLGVTTVSGSFTASAILRKTPTGSFTANAAIKKTIAPTGLTADAYFVKTITGSLTADAFKKGTVTGSFSAAAVILLPGGTTYLTDHFNRTIASGLGTAEDGGVYSFASVYGHTSVSVANGMATITSSGGSDYAALWTSTSPTSLFYCLVRLRTTAGTDGSLNVGLVDTGTALPFGGGAAFFSPEIAPTTMRAVSISYGTGAAYTNGDWWYARVRVVPGVGVSTRIWRAGDSEPTSWGLETAYAAYGSVAGIAAAPVGVGTTTYAIDEIHVYGPNVSWLDADAVLKAPSSTKTFSADAVIRATIADYVAVTQTSGGADGYITGLSSNEGWAQSISLATSLVLSRVGLRLKKLNSPPDDLAVSVVSALDGTPLATTTIAGANLSTSFRWEALAIGPVALQASTTYYIQALRSGAPDSFNAYIWGLGGNNYVNGSAWARQGGSWVESAVNDLTFVLYAALTISADAILLRTQSPVATITNGGLIPLLLASAKTTPGGLLADAVLTTGGVITHSGSLTTDADIFGAVAGSFSADAVFKAPSATKTFSADAVLKATITEWTPISQTVSNDADWLLGGTGASEELAQSFLGGFTAIRAQLKLDTSGDPTDNVVLDIVSALDGTPLATSTISASSVPSSPGWKNFTLDHPVALGISAYYLQLHRSGGRDNVNYVRWSFQHGDVYAGGSSWIRSSGSWNNQSIYDQAFLLYASLGLTADAVIVAGQQTISGSFSAAAVIFANSGTKTLTAAAITRQTFSPTFTSAALIKATQAGSVTANAVLKATKTGSSTANAITKASGAGSLTAAAITKRTQTGSLTTAAIIKRTQSGSLTAAAVKTANSGTKTFVANAVIAILIFEDTFSRTTERGMLGGVWWDAYRAPDPDLSEREDVSANGSVGRSINSEVGNHSYYQGLPLIDRGLLRVDVKTPLTFTGLTANRIWLEFYANPNGVSKLDIGWRNDGSGPKLWAGSTLADLYLPDAEVDTWYTFEIGFSLGTDTTSSTGYTEPIRIWKRSDPSVRVEWTGAKIYGNGYVPAWSLWPFYDGNVLAGQELQWDNVRIYSDQTAFTESTAFPVYAFLQKTVSGSFSASAAIATLIFSDDFNRTVAKGLGGPWSYSTDYLFYDTNGPEDAYSSVDGAEALITKPAGWPTAWEVAESYRGLPNISSGTIQFDLYRPYHTDFDLAFHVRSGQIYVGGYTNGDVFFGTAVGDHRFAPPQDAWLRCKANFGLGAQWSFKIWAVGSPEPDWQYAMQEGGASGNPAWLSFEFFLANQVAGTSNLTIDNVLLWSSEAAWTQTLQIFARAWIAASATTITGSFSVASVIKGTQSGTLTAASITKATGAGSLSVAAVIARTVSSSLTAAATKKATLAATFTADAVKGPKVNKTGSLTANAVVRRAVTASLAASAIVNRTATGSLTADAATKATQSGSFVALAVKAGTFTGSAWIAARFSADAFFVGGKSGFFNVDAWVAGPRFGSLSADATIRGTHLGTLSADGVVRRTASLTASADAVVRRVAAASLTTDAIVKRTTTGSLTGDAWLQRTVAPTLTAAACIQKTLTGSFSANAIFRRVEGGSLIAEAVTTQASVGSFLANGILRSPAAGAVSANAVIWGTQTGTLSANARVMPLFTAAALIRRTQTGTFTANALVMPRFSAYADIKATISSTFSADAFLKSGKSGFLNVDAVLRRNISGTFDASAALGRSGAGSLTASALLQIGRTGSFGASALVLAHESGSATADALVLARASGTANASAVLRAPQTRTFTADAAISGATTFNLFANSVLKANRPGTFSADALAQRATSATFSINAIILGVRASSFTTDAAKLKTCTGGLSASAVLRQTRTAGFDANAALLSLRSGSLVADAWIRGGTASAFSVDAVIRATRAGSLTASAIRSQSFSGGQTADAWVQGRTTGSALADAVLRRPVPGSLTGSATFRVGQSGSFDAAAFITRHVIETFSADAALVSYGIWHLLADAILAGKNERHFSVDASISARIYGSIAATWNAATIAATSTGRTMVATSTAGTMVATYYIPRGGSFRAEAWLE